MKIRKTLLAVAMLMLSAATLQAAPDGKNLLARKDLDVSKLMRRMAPNAALNNTAKMQKLNALNARLDARLENTKNTPAATPQYSFGPEANFSDLDGPNHELWYYTTRLTSKAEHFEWYTEYILQEYEFEIYNSKFELVGTIHDKMRYAADEVMVPGPLAGIDLLPVVTKNYFNQDDKIEVVVSLSVNTIHPGYNRYRSLVYSLDGEKETVVINRNGVDQEVEVDKPVAQLDAFIIDVLDASTSEEENYFLTFSNDLYTANPPAYDDDDDYWHQLSTAGSSYCVYSKANAEGKLTKVFDRFLPYIQLQGDQESTPPMVTFARDGQAFLLFPYYKEPFFDEVHDYFEDLTMRAGNSLIIELYRLNADGAELYSKTEIPALKPTEEGVIGNYYSVGDLEYRRDIRFDADGRPLYVVTRSSYIAAMDDTSGYCFYLYNADGERLLTFFEGADAHIALSDVEGENPQHMFVYYDEVEGYVYNMVDLVTGFSNETTQIPYLLDNGTEDPDILLFSADRAKIGDGFKYAFEVRSGVVNAAGDTFIRIAWFNADGSFDRVDNVNMGPNVQYAQAYINGSVLVPDLLCSDATQEYMILVKRGVSQLTSESQEELLIAQPANADYTGGRTIFHLAPDASKGQLSTIALYPGETGSENRLMIGYLNHENYNYSVDFYDLPLFTSGIEGMENSERFPANTNAYNLAGQRVGPGFKGLVIQNGRKVIK